MSTTDETITRDRLEAAFRDLRADVDRATPTLLARILPTLATAVVALTAVAYLRGRRIGRKRSTVFEIRRI